MRIYFDSSALIKRSVEEAESDAVELAMGTLVRNGSIAVSSSLAWVEVSRAIRSLVNIAADDGADGGTDGGANDEMVRLAIDGALAGVAEHLITPEVIGLAKRIAPTRLRTLDAIHLASAVMLDSDLVVAYDERLLDACRKNGLAVSSPGQ